MLYEGEDGEAYSAVLECAAAVMSLLFLTRKAGWRQQPPPHPEGYFSIAPILWTKDNKDLKNIFLDLLLAISS